MPRSIPGKGEMMYHISDLLPAPPTWQVPWSAAEQVLGGMLQQMRQTPQNPRWHGEGSVLAHTKLVCQAMAGLEAYREADGETRKILYLAALLHDIGKIRTTRLEDGAWVSYGHARVGAEMARQILWQDFGLCGTPEKQRMREAVCYLIRYHGLPPHAIEDPDGKLKLLRAAANGELAPAFTVRLLCTLEEADARGRICADQADFLDRVQLCAELAKEAGCYTEPYPFPSAYTAYCCLAGKNVPPNVPLYDDTWGEVILLSGLPGTGKDTWIRNHYPELPMVSLDAIREKQKIAPTGPQSQVVELAREQAKALLRQKKPFVWNATNISPMTRQKQVELFQAYGASVRILYLETDWDEQLRRNAGRRTAVPESVIRDMLGKLTPPERYEAPRVVWSCV